MSVWDDAAAAIAGDPNMGVAATYTPQGEAPMAINVVISRLEQPAAVMTGAPGMNSTAWMAMVLQADVPDRPRRGERLEVGTEAWTIASAEADEVSATWRLMLTR